ncbi:MAG: heavy metal translocating P-type ATPase metal-binding domain-containing protein, partial [Bacteroidetes bacterium]|nr:heavy metal translocating P-type ATPase metal-binding domain-containing protein [Bacteroidota bacterium]
MEQLEILERKIDSKLLCYHCGDECQDDSISIGENFFCCNGCMTVYQILNESNLCDYYAIDQTPGVSRKHHIKRNYDFLNDPDLKHKLIDFTNGEKTTITFEIPQMHCSSCIWILENLYKLDDGIVSSKVNFLQKKIYLQFLESKTSLRKIVELLDSIGYEPQLNLEEKNEEKSKSEYKKLYYKIGVAGFCFGNIMLLSFPEYLSVSLSEQENLKHLFAYINIVLALPVFFFSSSDYFISAWKGLKKKIVNIDVPIALGISVLFFRSLTEIIFFHGAGYLDSLSGLIFFLLAGKLFQNKTYDTLNFERNYKSYFPIAVTIRKDGRETTIPVEKLAVGNRLIIRNNELIPADAVLIKGEANIDYGFVTGESIPVHLKNGEMIYAGGKQIGSAVEVETVKDVSQSYLTQLWNNKAFHEERESRITSLANTISKHFTFAVTAIAVAAGLYWLPNYNTAFDAFTAVLIIACPCALALSTPFTLGNTLRIFGRNKFYLKNTHTIEKLASVEMIVFDKTGT